MKQVIFEVVDSGDGGYTASALGHHIVTQGEDWANLRTMIREAVQCHFEGEAMPDVIRLIHTREELLAA